MIDRSACQVTRYNAVQQLVKRQEAAAARAAAGTLNRVVIARLKLSQRLWVFSIDQAMMVAPVRAVLSMVLGIAELPPFAWTGLQHAGTIGLRIGTNLVGYAAYRWNADGWARSGASKGRWSAIAPGPEAEMGCDARGKICSVQGRHRKPAVDARVEWRQGL
jgi:hypothetical protein